MSRVDAVGGLEVGIGSRSNGRTALASYGEVRKKTKMISLNDERCHGINYSVIRHKVQRVLERESGSMGGARKNRRSDARC